MDLYTFVVNFKYVAIFLGAFIEGPTVGMIVGFLSRIHYFNLIASYLLHVSGDLAADFMYYLIGFYGGVRIVPKIARFFKFSVQDVINTEKSFNKHSKKLIIIGKISHVFGFPILIAAGGVRYKWYKFLIFDLIATFIKSAGLLFIGWHFGALWERVDNWLLILSGVALLIILAQFSLLVVRRFIKIKNGEIKIDKDEEDRLLKKWQNRKKRGFKNIK